MGGMGLRPITQGIKRDEPAQPATPINSSNWLIVAEEMRLMKRRKVKTINNHSIQRMIKVDLFSCLFFSRSALFQQMKNLFFAERRARQSSQPIQLFSSFQSSCCWLNEKKIELVGWAALFAKSISPINNSIQHQSIN